MIFYLIILLGVIVASGFIKKAPIDIRLPSAVGTGILTVFCLLLYSAIIHDLCSREVNRVDHKEDLFSLKMENSISGRFHLGTGYFNGEQRYYYYLKDSEGFLGLYSAPHYNVKIKEQDGKPYIYYQIIERRPSWLLVPSFFPSIFEETKIYMYIPEGSVIAKFDPN